MSSRESLAVSPPCSSEVESGCDRLDGVLGDLVEAPVAHVVDATSLR